MEIPVHYSRNPIEESAEYLYFVVVVMATLSNVLCSLKAFHLHDVGYLLSPRMAVPPSFSSPPLIYVPHLCSTLRCAHCTLEFPKNHKQRFGDV